MAKSIVHGTAMTKLGGVEAKSISPITVTTLSRPANSHPRGHLTRLKIPRSLVSQEAFVDLVEINVIITSKK